MTIYFVINTGKGSAMHVARAAAEILAQGKATIITAENGRGLAGTGFTAAVYPSEQAYELCDVILTIGGDGTMLHAARRLIEHGVPLVGVNLGRLGFLTDIARSSATERLAEILDGAFTAEDRFMLDVEVLRGGARVFHTLALNDVVVNKGELGRMIEFDLSIDDEFVYTQRSDGMIVSTPTGSTAYAFSCGGPVIWPDVSALLLVPVAAHALFTRPLVVGPDSCLEVLVQRSGSAPCEIWCDGRRLLTAPEGSRIRVRRGPRPVRLARLNDAPFSSRLVAKFDLPVEGWRANPPRTGEDTR